MHFLPDVYVTCEVCKGKRYNRETLEIRYKGRNIAEVLEMTVREALAFFEPVPAVRQKLQTLHDVGLDYIRLGQAATTLSGGEAQRVKLSTELSRRATGRTLYILDEPTTGLHFADIQRLLDVLNQLVDQGNTVVVIEHNLDVVKTADHIVDLGPEGGDEGGRVVAAGTPEQLAAEAGASYTGRYLAHALRRMRRRMTRRFGLAGRGERRRSWRRSCWPAPAAGRVPPPRSRRRTRRPSSGRSTSRTRSSRPTTTGTSWRSSRSRSCGCGARTSRRRWSPRRSPGWEHVALEGWRLTFYSQAKQPLRRGPGRHVIVQEWSGGAHCCFDYHVLHVQGTQIRREGTIRGGDCSLRVADLDQDGALELIACDSRFAYAFDLPFAESPLVPVVYTFRDRAYAADNRRFPQVYQFRLSQERRRLAEAERAGDARGARRAVLSLLLHALYAGRVTEAWCAFDRAYRWADRADVRQEVLRRLRLAPDPEDGRLPADRSRLRPGAARPLLAEPPPG